MRHLPFTGVALTTMLTSLPVTLLIDRNGKIADTRVGMVDKGAWEEEMRTLVQERSK
jgi:hypothetical protein